MTKRIFLTLFTFILVLMITSFQKKSNTSTYENYYYLKIKNFENAQKKLIASIYLSALSDSVSRKHIQKQLDSVRLELKAADFWLRYLEPISYKLINGPLPVEWETEVFEKFEKPYKRTGAGITLAQQYLEQDTLSKKHLVYLLETSLQAINVFYQDSIASNLKKPDHFFFCNRLFLLNLAAIYSTGFECPNTEQIIPELKSLLWQTKTIYAQFNANFSQTPLSENYLNQYNQLLEFITTQPNNFKEFNHYAFIRDYVNPLFAINQHLIVSYQLKSQNNQDYSLNNNVKSIFNKSLYYSQNTKGVYSRITDSQLLKELENLGKMLFYDPILSANNLRSCASCHKPNEMYTDTFNQTSLHYNHSDRLPRNTPTLLNAPYNHLLMLDGKHITLQHQTKDVMTNQNEMASVEKEILEKILSCSDYKKTLKKLQKHTPQETSITLEHVSSALTYYYSQFSKYQSRFDLAMNQQQQLTNEEIKGFNLFMSKAQCGTCHFVPQFNGVKPPYVGSEFEVLGVPQDTLYSKLSDDLGRYYVNPATETHRAFRTGTIRNSSKTKPYMHNGVFTSLNQVIEFYDGGGGAGRGLNLANQTLSSDSLHLTTVEKKQLMAFINSLNEEIPLAMPPTHLPQSSLKALNRRKVSGEY